MPSKFRKFDIGQIRRPANSTGDLEKDLRNWQSGTSHPANNYAELISHKAGTRIISKLKKPSKWSLAPFAMAVLAVMLFMQSGLYLSSARNAQGEILGEATTAYSDLSTAGSNLKNQNFADAQTMFDSALSNLQSAQNKLNDYKALQLVAKPAAAADHILSGATYLATAGKQLSTALSLFDQLKISSAGVNTSNLADQLKQNRDLLTQSLAFLKKAQSEFDAVSGLPDSYNDTLQSARQQVDALTGILQKMSDLEELYLGMFGNGPKVYLMLFENYDEARATGGFLGTYGVLKIDDGKIQSLKIDSIYDLDGHIYNNVAAPGPFQPDIQKWGIRDANWFADFPQSSRKLLQFFESGAETADGVILFTPSIFEDLLRLTGPIAMPDYGVTLNADNFQTLIQYKTSTDYDKKTNQPKKLLSDFAPVLLDRLSSLNRDQWLALLQIMQTNLSQKQVLMYSKDQGMEQKIEDMRFAGNILPSEQDYLNIVNTNLGGTKSDLKVKQKARLKSKILSDGSIIDTLTIERSNTALAANRDFMRVLVPLGSTLLSSHGFDEGKFEPSASEGLSTDPDLAAWDKGKFAGDYTFVRTEAGKTEFTGWLNTSPNETKTVTLIYTIPYKASVNLLRDNVVYSLLFQKQAGTKAYDFSAAVDPGSLKPSWISSDSKFESGNISFDYTTGSDQYWAALLSK